MLSKYWTLNFIEKGAIITYQFPQRKQDEIIQSAPVFCFPEGNLILEKKTTKLETFSFTLTSGNGERKFGYCRRFVSNASEPECYCIISKRWHGRKYLRKNNIIYYFFSSSFSFFSVILDIVEERRKYNNSAVFTFLKTLSLHNLPNAGESFTITTFSSGGSSFPEKYEFTLPPQNDFLLDYVGNTKFFLNEAKVKQKNSLF